MAVATEILNGAHQEAIRPWSLPERLSGSNVTLSSIIDERSTGLSVDELTDVYLGVVELASEITGGRNETGRAWGFDFQRGKEPDTYIVRHQGQGQSMVQGEVRIKPHSPYAPEFELFDASVVR